MTYDTNINQTDQDNGSIMEGPQSPPRRSNTTPTRVKRLEKRVSIDLMPMTIEEIEWAMGDCKVQEEEREIQEIRERIQRRKAAAAANDTASHSD